MVVVIGPVATEVTMVVAVVVGVVVLVGTVVVVITFAEIQRQGYKGKKR